MIYANYADDNSATDIDTITKALRCNCFNNAVLLENGNYQTNHYEIMHTDIYRMGLNVSRYVCVWDGILQP